MTATHIAWNHPATAEHVLEAGIIWLGKIAGLNPASSLVIREWDQAQGCDWEIRSELLRVFKEDRIARRKLAQGHKRVFTKKCSAK